MQVKKETFLFTIEIFLVLIAFPTRRDLSDVSLPSWAKFYRWRSFCSDPGTRQPPCRLACALQEAIPAWPLTSGWNTKVLLCLLSVIPPVCAHTGAQAVLLESTQLCQEGRIAGWAVTAVLAKSSGRICYKYSSLTLISRSRGSILNPEGCDSQVRQAAFPKGTLVLSWCAQLDRDVLPKFSV